MHIHQKVVTAVSLKKGKINLIKQAESISVYRGKQVHR